MKLKDSMKLSFISLTQRGMRSALTVLGIVIGIAALISLVGVGQGVAKSIEAQFNALGADVLTITAGASRAIGFSRNPHSVELTETTSITSEDRPSLGKIDWLVIQNTQGVETVNPQISSQADVEYLNEEISLSIRGVDPQGWKDITTEELALGRFLNPTDPTSVIIGSQIASDIFTQELTLNSQISIDGGIFRVVGILETGNNDKSIIMTLDAADSLFESDGEYSNIRAKVLEGYELAPVVTSIENNLRISRSVLEDDEDFTVSSPEFISDRLEEMTATMSIFMGAIASIALLVGAIGIANTMYMSVMERTRQIGVFKSLGMTDSEIMNLFLFESAFLGLVGGIIGIFVGYIIAGIISAIGMRLGPGGTMTPYIPIQLVIFALCFSVITGALSGFFPARKAARMVPVEALRYE